MKKKPLRVIVVGYGAAGEQLTRLLVAEPCCRVVSVVDPSAGALAKATSLYQLSTFATLGKALEATDADVAVLTAPAHHAFDLAMSALEHGLHVVLTRPIAETSKLLAFAEARQRRLGLARDPVSARDYLKELEAAARGKAPGPASPENR
jgi:predicted dehydrogenase